MIVFTDGVQRIVVKTKYAYHYNKAGSFYGKTEFGHKPWSKPCFINKLIDLGFKADKQEYREEGSGSCRCLYPKDQETFHSLLTKSIQEEKGA